MYNNQSVLSLTVESFVHVSRRYDYTYCAYTVYDVRRVIIKKKFCCRRLHCGVADKRENRTTTTPVRRLYRKGLYFFSFL
jgi:hypothetical protein